jgi:hypothetical protein
MKRNILPKVKRTAFTRLNPTRLSEFAHNVLTQTKGVEVYKMVETVVAELEAAVQALDNLIVERYNSGRLDTQRRMIAVNEVHDFLQKTVLLLEANANGNPDFLVNAGFECILSSAAHRITQLSVPVITTVSPTLVPGQIELLLAECRGARSFAFEFSYDKGVEWQNGVYSSKLRNRFIVNTNDEVLVRVKAIGAGNSVSEFCAPMGCKVL